MVHAQSEFPHSLLFALRRLYKVSEVRGMGKFSLNRLDIRADSKEIEPILKATWLLQAISKYGVTAHYRYIMPTEPQPTPSGREEARRGRFGNKLPGDLAALVFHE